MVAIKNMVDKLSSGGFVDETDNSGSGETGGNGGGETGSGGEIGGTNSTVTCFGVVDK
jgi:hypothetical protein